jgi:hypothetical protein
MYAGSSRKAGGQVIEVPLGPGFAFPLEDVIAAITTATRIVFLTTPHNPTGLLIPREAVVAIASAAPQALVFVDEAYIDFGGDTLIEQPLLDRYPNLEYIGQNRDALRLLLWGVGSDTIPDPSPFPAHRSHRLLREDRTRMFVDPWPWFDHLRQLDFVFGTRIHGNVAALLAGTPAYVLAHDSRTLELARTFEIPHRLMTDVRPETDAAELYAEADYGPLVTGHPARFERFIGFVERHGLRHVFEPGEDPSAFDRKIASIDFPPAVRVRRNVLLHRIRGRSGRLIRRVSRSLAPAVGV